MNTIELRNRLSQYINTADDRLLRVVNAVFESYNEEDEAVAYTVDGKPLTLTEYKNEIKEAEAEIERGEYITHEELKQEVATWGK